MNKYLVYTACGDWEIYATSPTAAAQQVRNITLGRCGSIDAVRRAD